ncbi:hypothetical protein [Nocardia sp. CA-145437]|uniref:hypothetical protein n=1 Tax=Nocardia sp. CA-145437 TaxID=3239980 RepID=UPI003D98271D
MSAVMSPVQQGQPRSKRVWIVGAVVLGVAIAAGAVFLITSGSSDEAAAGPTYHDTSDECTLVSAALLSRYTPGAQCRRTPTMTLNPDEVTHTPSWTTADSVTHPVSIQVVLRMAAGSPAMYSRAQSSLSDVYQPQLNESKSIEITPAELGSKVQSAVMVSGSPKAIPGRSDARLILRSGNAVVDVVVNDWNGAAASEAAAKAIAADVVANLH